MDAHLNFFTAESQEFHMFMGTHTILQRAQHETFNF